MDAKDLRTDTNIGDRSNNGSSKYPQGGTGPGSATCIASKTFENSSANPLAKMEAPTSRPCAVIGPDRIVPPASGDAFAKKSHYEPWLHMENTYRQPPEYPHKLPSYNSPIRNISPRQTFQENMQRIMVQPTCNSVKLNDDPSYAVDRNTTKNSKINGPHEVKYCDVPYSVNPISSDQKPNEMCVTNINSSRNYPQMWHHGNVGIRPTRPYGAPDLYQFPEYTNCAGSRTMPMPRPHRTINEDNSHAYSDTYFPEGNIRFKPYPTVKDRYPPARYEYVSNYANPFHPTPHFPPHKYDLQKPLPPNMAYPQVPIKYLDNRMPDAIIDGYQRPQPVNYNIPYRNQVIHPAYGPMMGTNLQNKVYPYPPDGPAVKSLGSNKLPYDPKLYAEYENTRNKSYPINDNVYLNDMVRAHTKNQPMLPNYPTGMMQPIHGHPYYRKENLAAKNYEYMSHLRHLDPSINPNTLTRISTQFSPNSIAISPSDSNTSNETSHTHGGSLEDCGYVSQSSATSIRSYDSGINRIIPNDFHQRYNYPYQTMVRTSPFSSKSDGNANSSKDKKGIDVRQFLQMWNEGEEENGGKEKEAVPHSEFNSSKLTSQYEAMKNNELYVLGLVNVPSEELGKYEHIQKISKLPENIKGYNNIELLKHFEEAIESSNVTNQNNKPPTPRNHHPSMKSFSSFSMQGTMLLPPRPISPLDVEAKISQSVIHKEVGCNFEIKPCSPQMLNAEVATTAQNILGEERVIEKVSNPMIIESPILISSSETDKLSDVINQKEHKIMLTEDVNKISSCKMVNTQCSNNEAVNVTKANYSLQELESNAGVCLASLPRLDNDIELNFPEVNQQFINANKESVIIANDFTSELEAIPNDNYNVEEKGASKSDELSSEMPLLDLEKEVSKLSKYRKNKKKEMENQEKQFIPSSQSLRTDSVIIKNPENTKSLEKHTLPLDITTNESKTNQIIFNSKDISNSPASDKIKKESNEMAIDFSLNKDENKHSKYFCEMYSTKNLDPLPEKISVNTQLSEDTKATRDLLIDSTNYITTKLLDETNDIKLTAIKNVEECNEVNFESGDIKIRNDVQRENEDNSPENMSEMFTENFNKETDPSNIILTSTPVHVDAIYQDKILEKTESEIVNKSIKKTERINTCLSTSLTDNNEKDNVKFFESAPITHQVYEKKLSKSEDNSYSEMLSKISDINDNTSTEMEFKHTAESDYLDKQNDNTDKLDNGTKLNQIDTTNSIVDATEQMFRLNKEMFSPRMQNLVLQTEGLCDLQNEDATSAFNMNDLKNNNAIVKNLFLEDSNLHAFPEESLGSIAELQSEDNSNKVSNSDAEVTFEDRNTTNVMSQSKHLDTCHVLNSDAKNDTADNIDRFTNWNNSEVQLDPNNREYCLTVKSESTNSVENYSEIKLEPNDIRFGSVAPHSNKEYSSKDNVDNISTADDTSKEFQSESITANIKDCEMFDPDTETSYNVNTVCDDNIEFQEEHTKSSIICDLNKDTSEVDNLNGNKDRESDYSLLSHHTHLKDTVGNTDIEMYTGDDLNTVKEYASIECQPENTNDVKHCPIDVISLKNNTNTDLPGQPTNYTNCTIFCSKVEISAESHAMNDTINDIQISTNAPENLDTFKKPSELCLFITKNYLLSDSDVELSVDRLTMVEDCIKDEEYQSEYSDDKVFLRTDSDIILSSTDNSKTMESSTSNEVNSESNEKSSENNLSFIQDIHCSKTELSSKANHSDDPNLVPVEESIETTITEELTSSSNILESVDSGVQNTENDATIFDKRVKETDTHDNLSDLASEKELVQMKTNNEDVGIIVSSNIKEWPNRRCLKRSLSDSALEVYKYDKSENDYSENYHNLIKTKKRRKNNDIINITEPHYTPSDVLNIHNIRRNSVSTTYNEENMSFCIVIDNDCIIAEENEDGEKLCYTEISEECLGIQTDNFEEGNASEIILCPQENADEYNESVVLEISDEKSLEESWVDDVACIETVVSDDIAEDIELSVPSSPTEIDEEEEGNDESGIFTSINEHTGKVKYIYGDKMCNGDAEFVETLYRTPQMNVNKTLIERESYFTDNDYELDEENQTNDVHMEAPDDKTVVEKSDFINTSHNMDDTINKLNTETPMFSPKTESDNVMEKNKFTSAPSEDNTINSCESSMDNVFSYNQDENSSNASVFSSPEVSSTTSEERSTSLLLKITNCQGMRTSQINDMNLTKTNSCKFTENINYTNFISNSKEPRPLITKAAQKYIPPLKETPGNLKVKLPLPRDSLMKYRQLKMSKIEVKQNSVPKKDIPKKPKPKFEDVLKSIDEQQFKMHREKNKKPKKSVPKVVIKKTENGSHYTSTPNRDCFNPDLTGRKWQPWVFIEKNNFIDKMALRRKTKAVYNHRKNTYVFADKFKKYKSMPSTKFVITQPKFDDPSGQLKYTIRLKHTY